LEARSGSFAKPFGPSDLAIARVKSRWWTGNQKKERDGVPFAGAKILRKRGKCKWDVKSVDFLRRGGRMGVR